MSVSEKIQFCTIAELKEKKIVTKWVDDWRDEVSAIFSEDRIEVFSSVCPHFGGEVKLFHEPTTLRCKWHGWYFDLRTGQCLSSKTNVCLRKYSFQEKNDFLEVTLP